MGVRKKRWLSSRALLRLTTKSARVYNSMTVDNYPTSPAARAILGE
jgi:hypothetical protein